MSGLSTSTQNTQQATANQSNPWAPQAGYLTQGFQDASNALSKAQSTGVAPTGFTAQYTPAMLDAFQQQLGYGTSNGNIPASSAAAGEALTGAGAAGAGQGLFNLANFNPSATNNVGNVTNAAGAYANNPYTQGMVDAATRDAIQSVNENVIPQIERNAAGSGNINSNRTGIAEGIVERGLANTVADTSANLRGGLYNTGLGLAENQAATNNSQTLGANTALTSGGTGAASAGVNANTGAVNQAGGLFNIANQGTAGLLAGQQANLTNQQQAWDFSQNSPFTALNNYWNTVGSRLYGSSGYGTNNGTQQTTPSTLTTLGGLLGGASSLFGGYRAGQ